MAGTPAALARSPYVAFALRMARDGAKTADASVKQTMQLVESLLCLMRRDAPLSERRVIAHINISGARVYRSLEDSIILGPLEGPRRVDGQVRARAAQQILRRRLEATKYAVEQRRLNLVCTCTVHMPCVQPF